MNCNLSFRWTIYHSYSPISRFIKIDIVSISWHVECGLRKLQQSSNQNLSRYHASRIFYFHFFLFSNYISGCKCLYDLIECYHILWLGILLPREIYLLLFTSSLEWKRSTAVRIIYFKHNICLLQARRYMLLEFVFLKFFLLDLKSC